MSQIAIPANDDPAANVDKIREILFGGHMRDYERRFAAIEERLFSESAQLRQDLTERLARIESELRQELTKLGEAGLRERSDRLEALRGLDVALEHLGDTLLSRLSAVDQRLNQDLQQLRQQLQDQLRTDSGQLAGRLDDLEQRIGRDKTGRAELAELFAEIAKRLESQPNS